MTVGLLRLKNLYGHLVAGRRREITRCFVGWNTESKLNTVL